MVRWLKYALLLLLGVCLVTMALANRAPVQLHFLPEGLSLFLGVDIRLELPLFLVLFLAMILGLMIGFVWEWFREHQHRAMARAKGKEVTRLERELAVMRDTAPTPQHEILAILEKPKGR